MITCTFIEKTNNYINHKVGGIYAAVSMWMLQVLWVLIKETLRKENVIALVVYKHVNVASIVVGSYLGNLEKRKWLYKPLIWQYIFKHVNDVSTKKNKGN